ncbi:hypothetical protein CK203_074397 [Vitis vinifera]|uniref:DUF2470 domain-containing protein n=1 Tax=Vitis vinifera TaxID=29760 RepID=A0A438EGX6_VITVI|nr:hypothetical protein CK203_074397 [Vitis vinifera]
MKRVVAPTAWSISLIPRVNARKIPNSSPPFPNLFSPKPYSFFSSPLVRPLSMAASAAQTASPGDVTTDAEVFQLIKDHQEKAARLPPLEEIRTVINHSVRGMLSTISQKYEGYPSGSMVDFACDQDGYPILAVSSLANHTKDLLANTKCSLLVAKDPEDKTDLLITVHGDAVPVSEEDKGDIRTAYLTRHPNAFWVDFGDFQFMRIEPKVVRYVSGIATALLDQKVFLPFIFLFSNHMLFHVFICFFIFYLSEFTKEAYTAAKVDPIAQFSKPVASHMNRDHAEDTKLIVQHVTSILVM